MHILDYWSNICIAIYILYARNLIVDEHFLRFLCNNAPVEFADIDDVIMPRHGLFDGKFAWLWLLGVIFGHLIYKMS